MCAYAKRLLVCEWRFGRLLLLLTAVVMTAGHPFHPNLAASELPRYSWEVAESSEDIFLSTYAREMNQNGDVVGRGRKVVLVEVWNSEENAWKQEYRDWYTGVIYDEAAGMLQDISTWFPPVDRDEWPHHTYDDGTQIRYPIVKGEDDLGWRINNCNAINSSQEMLASGSRYQFDNGLGRYVREDPTAIRITFVDADPLQAKIEDLSALLHSVNEWPDVTSFSPKNINDLGHITGVYWGPHTTARGFYYDVLNQTIVDLGDLGKDGVFPGTLNSFGQIAGNANVDVRDLNSTRAFRYSPETGLVNLGMLQNVVDGSSNGLDINDSGTVVGRSHVKRWTSHAFRYTDDEGMVDLGTLGGTNSEAWGINNSGAIVGLSEIAEGGRRVFLYTDADGMVDLDSLIDEWPAEYFGHLQAPMKISDTGIIVANNQLIEQMVILRPITGEVGVQVTIVEPADLSFVSGNNVPVTAEATSPAGIQAVTFFIEGDSGQVIPELTGEDLSNDIWSVTWDTTTESFPDGPYTIRAVATDVEGASAEDSIEVWVQNDEPLQPQKMSIQFTESPSIFVGRNHWQASVTVTVSKEDGTELTGALVAGTWSDGKTETIESSALFESNQIHRRISSVTFTVTDVELTGYIWEDAPVSITISSP